MEPIYEETFTRTIDKESLVSFLAGMSDTYKRTDGWTIGNATITTVNDREIEVSIPLKKYDTTSILEMREEGIPYQEDFVRTIFKSDLNSFMSKMYESYPQEEGWIVGEPQIISENGNEITVKVPLEKNFGKKL